MEELNLQIQRWDSWNQTGGPKYPHEKVVQFCFRNYPAAERAAIRALDLGCGGGVHTAFLAREGFRTSACDMSSVAVEHTRSRLAAEGLTATVQTASLEKIEYPDASFDLVICSSVLEACGLDTARAALARLPRFLAPGAKGFFLFAGDRDMRIVQENRCRLHGYTRDEVVEVFSPFAPDLWIDRYITTYENGQREQFDWLVTIFKAPRA